MAIKKVTIKLVTDGNQVKVISNLKKINPLDITPAEAVAFELLLSLRTDDTGRVKEIITRG